MATPDCSSEMTKYHKEKVTLKKADQDDMRSRRNSGRTRLDSGLQRDGHALPKETASQGSYAMRTMVQDPECDYDIDDGAYFKKDDLKDENGNELTPYQARLRVCNALKQDGRLKYEAEVHNNCVRQAYPEGYHIDVPVYRIVTLTEENGDTTTQYELASKDAWSKSDARGVTRWFTGVVGDLNTGEDDGNQLRRTTRLTKKFARSRADWKDNVPSGIALTKLVVECFVAKSGRDDEALHDTWKAIKARLDKSLRIEHPVLDQDLADEGDAKVAFFQDHLKEALKDLEILDEDGASSRDARKAWDKSFNTTFFSDQPDDEGTRKGEAAAAPFFVVSKDVAQRNDSGRRFG